MHVEVQTGRGIALYTRARDFLEGPYQKAEIQRKALKRGKNLAFIEIHVRKKEECCQR